MHRLDLFHSFRVYVFFDLRLLIAGPFSCDEGLHGANLLLEIILSDLGLKLSVVLDIYKAMETYSRIGLVRSYGNLQSYWTSTKLWKLTVVLD